MPNCFIGLNRMYVLMGYKDLLEKAPPNGATVHEIRNHIFAIQLCLEIGRDLPSNREERIKSVIRRLYPEQRPAD